MLLFSVIIIYLLDYFYSRNIKRNLVNIDVYKGVFIYESDSNICCSHGIFTPYVIFGLDKNHRFYNFAFNHEIGHSLHYHKLLLLFILLMFNQLLDTYVDFNNTINYIYAIISILLLYKLINFLCEIDADIYASSKCLDKEIENSIIEFEEHSKVIDEYIKTWIGFIHYYIIDDHPNNQMRIKMLKNRSECTNIFTYYLCYSKKNEHIVINYESI